MREIKVFGPTLFIGLTTFLSLGLSSFLSFGQSPRATSIRKAPFTLKIPVNLVLVPVSVKDGEDQPLYGLKKEDFRILEEGVRQDLSYFSSDPLPLSVALLIDRSLNSQAQSRLKATLLALIESFSDFDEIALFKFHYKTDKVLDFSLDKNKVLETLRTKLSWERRSPGILSGPFSPQTTVSGIEINSGRENILPPKTWTTHIHDAMFSAVQSLRGRRRRESRKMILIVSDGHNAPGNQNSFNETLEALLRAEIVVYSIAQTNRFFRSNTLSKYAKSTGGESFAPLKTNSLAKTYQKITQSARNQYVLGYIPNAPPKRVSFRKIKVQVIRNQTKNLKVRSRKGYYAIPTL